MIRGLHKVALRIVRRSTSEEDPQSGAAMVLVALMMTVLIGFAAFSVDFGWLYLNGLRIQHGADAAALAGVIYEPGDQSLAFSEARLSALHNGYDHAAAGTTVTPVDFTIDPTAVNNQFQLSVTIEQQVRTFFMNIFGIDNITMRKTAIAEYVLPLPMGSDLPYFGTDPSDPARQPNFWANIHGYYTGRTMGDRYSSQCVNGGSGSGCTENVDARQTNFGVDGVPITGGYLYGIELDDTSDGLQIEVFDGPFRNINEPAHPFSGTNQGKGDYFMVGDNEQGGAGNTGPTTWFVLYDTDPTPLNTADNTVLCWVKFDPEFTPFDFDGDGDIGGPALQPGWNNGDPWPADPEDDLYPVAAPDGIFDWDDVEEGYPGGIAALWDPVCASRLTGLDEGVYPFRVAIENPGSDDFRGLNRYSLRSSTTTGSQPRFYGLGDMAIYVNFATSSATFNLAEVYPIHAGKELVIELWDPDSGNNGVRVERPDGTLPQCTWSNLDGSEGTSTLIPCDFTYSASLFNNDHLQIRIDVDPGYSCDTDPVTGNCWWTLEVRYNGSANDTTTWSSRIEGNPVKLVE